MMKIGVNIRNAYLLLKADFLKIIINKDGRVFMSRIIKNVLPYWKSIVLVFALLIVQAVCDLSLPAYTSDIIDTGIQNGGIEHTVPEKITKTAPASVPEWSGIPSAPPAHRNSSGSSEKSGGGSESVNTESLHSESCAPAHRHRSSASGSDPSCD